MIKYLAHKNLNFGMQLVFNINKRNIEKNSNFKFFFIAISMIKKARRLFFLVGNLIVT